MIARDNVKLRRATRADSAWIVERHAALYAASDGFDESFGALVARVVASFFEDENVEREKGWIATIGDRAIGSIFCGGTDDPDVARLRLFFLEPEARGLGLGVFLLETCVGFARSAGYARLILRTHESHISACRLYESFGFVRGQIQDVTSFGVAMTEVDYAFDLR